MLTLEQITKAVTAVASDFPITQIMLFGSYANGTNTPDSDVDLLIEFQSEAVSLLMLCEIKNRLEELLGVDVDVIHAPIPDGAIIEIDKVVPLYAA